MKTYTLALLFGCLAAAVFSTHSYSIDDNALITSNQLELSNSLLVNDGTSNSVPLGTIFRFTANTKSIQRECIVSSNITLNKIDWNMKLCKEESHVSFYLIASARNATYWVSEAQATIKLLSKVSSVQTIRHKTSKLIFTKEHYQYDVKNITTWENFEKSFVKDNQADFEIEISAGRVSYQKPKDVEQIYSRQHIMLDNVSKLVETKSVDVVIRGIKWSVHVAKTSDERLAVRLAAKDKELDMGYYYPVKAMFKLLSFDKNVAPITFKLSQNYRWGLSQFGNEQFLLWATFLDKSKQYVSQDKASLLVEIQVDEPTSMWDFTENNLP